jgi:hypothetical protein
VHTVFIGRSSRSCVRTSAFKCTCSGARERVTSVHPPPLAHSRAGEDGDNQEHAKGTSRRNSVRASHIQKRRRTFSSPQKLRLARSKNPNGAKEHTNVTRQARQTPCGPKPGVYTPAAVQHQQCGRKRYFAPEKFLRNERLDPGTELQSLRPNVISRLLDS